MSHVSVSSPAAGRRSGPTGSLAAGTGADRVRAAVDSALTRGFDRIAGAYRTAPLLSAG